MSEYNCIIIIIINIINNNIIMSTDLDRDHKVADAADPKTVSPVADEYHDHDHDRHRPVSVSSSDDDAIYPKGTLDPVYEAKARVLNRAVRIYILSVSPWGV